MDYTEMFQRATGQEPFPYQRRLATCPQLPEALSAATGSGKTAAIVLAWLYRRRFASAAVRSATPRRLVYCLPMRTLVTQTAHAAAGWLGNLGLEKEIGVETLLGGADRKRGFDGEPEWFMEPEKDALLLGTQDMLLSRALNRAYGDSRFLWPWLFALVSSDCLWVFDEVQLMGVGLATGRQLGAFRRELGTYGPTGSLFVSATLDPAWLETVDAQVPVEVFRLSEEDMKRADLEKRRRAVKKLQKARVSIEKGWEKALAEEVLAAHEPRSRTLVVMNTVKRATELLDAISKRKNAPETVLLHSRFRPPEKAAALARALAAGYDGIVISTQVIEAGVDISARTLFTELAPWPSLVQRAGRCNRYGEEAEATVRWIDHSDEKAAPPYHPSELAEARTSLAGMAGFSPADIEKAAVPMRPPEYSHVIRRKDILDLFDTTPDLGGFDIDVSRFIRDGEERDVQVFWREIDTGGPDAEVRRPGRDELCPVPFIALRDLISSGRRAFRWDALGRRWKAVRQSEVFPGNVFMLDADAGGYDPVRGFDPVSTARVRTLEGTGGDPEEGLESDPGTLSSAWKSLLHHSVETRAEAESLRLALADLDELPWEAVVHAAHGHDVGKAHEVFRQSMKDLGPPKPDETWAKSGVRSPLRHSRPGFRHELASALVTLAVDGGEERDLVAYLRAAHHGKVRLSIRALAREVGPPDSQRRFARGVWDSDAMPAVDLGGGLAFPEVTLSLRVMETGRDERGEPSWTERCLGHLGRFGPFRLAYLEALVRVSDWRASRLGGTAS